MSFLLLYYNKTNHYDIHSKIHLKNNDLFCKNINLFTTIQLSYVKDSNIKINNLSSEDLKSENKSKFIKLINPTTHFTLLKQNIY